MNLEDVGKLYKYCMKNAKKLRKIYIYGTSNRELMLKKALSMMGIKAICTNEIPKTKFAYFKNCVIVPQNMVESVQQIGQSGYKFFIIDEKFINDIERKLSPKKNYFYFEVNLADHCNLNCQCCDHFSPLSPKKFLLFKDYQKDLDRLKELWLKDGSRHKLKINLLGGEPTLNLDLDKFVTYTRDIFPEAEISIVTNGINFLNLENFAGHVNMLKIFKDNNITIYTTHYPISVKYDKNIEKAKEYDLNYIDTNNIVDLNDCNEKFTIYHIFDKKKNIKRYEFLVCYSLNECTVLKDGKIYICPLSAYVDIYNNYFKQNLKITKKDYIDIYQVESLDEINEFLTYKIPFCDNCSLKARYRSKWGISKKDISEWKMTPNYAQLRMEVENNND